MQRPFHFHPATRRAAEAFSSMCEQCIQFRGSGLLVRAFECEGGWAAMPISEQRAPAGDSEKHDDGEVHLPIERFGPGHASSFYPPEYGASLLARASNSSDEHVQRFNACAQQEIFPTILRDGPWVGSAGPRPSSLLQESAVNVQYATYANSFGLTLRDSTRVVGAHAFDAWTTKPRPACKDEDQQAALRLEAVRLFCNHNMTSTSEPCTDAQHCRPRAVQPRSGKIKLNSSRLEQWPEHVALSRMLASSAANCRFQTPASMLRQQRLFRSGLRASGLLARCPYAWYAGAISQVAAVYDMSDVTGVFVLDWVPSHLPLAALAFKQLPRLLVRPLQLVRLARGPRGAAAGQAHRRERRDGEMVVGNHEHDTVTCSCHDVPWKMER